MRSEIRTNVIAIPSAVLDQMVDHAIAALPNEACGLLAGPGGRLQRFFPMTNADRSPMTYRLDPKEQIQAFNEFDELGWELGGIFHSHTHTEAFPSPTDRAQAFYPEALYLLVSLADRHEPVLRGFTIRDGEVDEQEVRITMSGFGGFTEDQVLRYSRHIILPKIGAAGQRKLLDAKVLAVGAGGLGSPVAMYLAAAGVGTLGVLDFDKVDLTNLQRQLLHDTDDVGRSKVDSAAERLNGINPDVNVVKHDTILTSDNAFDILGQYDVVVDGTDNFPVRYLVNDATQILGKPLVYGSIFQFDGQASVFMPGQETPCYRCLFPEPPPPGTVPSCAEGGVFGVLPGIIGSIQAVEAIKLITGIGEPLIGRLLLFDALEMDFTTVKLRWDPDCPVCGKHPTVTELIDYDQFCGLTPGQVPLEAEHGVATSVEA